jgi:hypothetical protein
MKFVARYYADRGFFYLKTYGGPRPGMMFWHGPHLTLDAAWVAARGTNRGGMAY